MNKIDKYGRKFIVKIEGEEYEVDVMDDLQSFQINGKEYSVDWSQISSGMYSVIIDGSSHYVMLSPVGENTYTSTINGKICSVEVEDEQRRLLKVLGKKTSFDEKILEISAPMPGLVLEVKVQENDNVEAGSSLILLEAMKMENEIRSPVKGRISALNIEKGRKVEKGQKLLKIEVQ